MRFATALLILAAGLTRQVSAFHEGGVANCKGCHTVHNSEDGMKVDPDHPNGDSWFLTSQYPSDICLNCHATSNGSLLANSPLSPAPNKGGGNFIFLKEDNLNDGSQGAINPIPGYAAGHNLNAPGHGLAPDATVTRSPGGSYPSSVMSCTSCHNPHGNSSFRMLYGVGNVPQGNYTFTSPAPVALGLPVTDASAENNGNHTAYRRGMSEWCSNCHGNFHDKSSYGYTSPFKHTAGKELGGGIANNYAVYNGTDNPTGGAYATAYLAQVPFEDAAATTTGTNGPSGNSRVMCLSCHRAHASSAPHSGRWDFNVTFLSQDGVQSGSYPLPNPYGSATQRALCEKCHGTSGL